MNPRRTPRRRGYTLLEVLIASVIGLLLMGAVYAAFSLIISSTGNGRDLTAESNLTRGIINRLAIDLGSPVGVLPPKSGGTPAGNNGSLPPSDSTAAATAAAPTAAGTDTADTGTATVTADSPIPFQAGVVGTADTLVIFISRSPEALRKRGADLTAAGPGDVVKVTYYVAAGGGLCRQERPWVTSDPVWAARTPETGKEQEDLIAPEVERVQFEYASGSGYVSSWDGTNAGADGTTNQGPPRGVKATFTLKLTDKDGKEVRKDVTHVFPIRASAGLNTSANTLGTNGTGTANTGTGSAPTGGTSP